MIMGFKADEKDCLVPLSQVPALPFLPRRNGKPMAKSTPYRWAVVGLGPKKIRLGTIQCGNTKCTTPRLLRKFFRQLAAAKGNGQGQPAPLKKYMQRRVEAELDREGF
jgi:hypothetical protein